ncbi:MAG TPA: putative sugar nucleotidyl transferase [Bacteroidales bacterium]|jgi:UDP-N-acetylglucosamine diphosphorylase/glucosamine-1-phosphate N-acetyltransferase|nr:glucose-1-phosphate thymidylyltransferase [Bacteroidales bacterium]MDI9573955.1 putative sugar nucleotidyl transferase [Bacteroidota bacterium]OQC60857.1 MAG: Bifunctional protein GlmU [Bacteroidetes bacterium ADurb.Bin012]MBP9588801.1 glucose-1-phosphate thymidylyltransferase [Bacteroidales bacterium]HNQ59160.1 putative sugar nucleotidyl transferase [Bacteroidales bacterium]
MNYILFDDYSRNNLLPLTFLRPVADLLTGILTIRQKWEYYLGDSTSSLTEDYLIEKYPLYKGKNNILINGSVLPSDELIKAIRGLQPNQALINKDAIIALHVPLENLDKIGEGDTEGIEEIDTDIDIIKINYLWDLFLNNAKQIEADYAMLTVGSKSIEPSKSNHIIAPENIFIEEGALVENCNLNATDGPIYIGHNAQIWDGASLRGPIAVGEHAIVKMNAIIYQATTIGSYSKVGGEVENSVIMAYSNKPHSGYLGHSIVGQWCNIAAGTNVANLNNTYKTIKMWNYPQSRFIDTGLQFCGLVLGDHSKTGINTTFNTGSVVGISSNVFGAGYQRNFVPSFVWGGPSTGYSGYDFEKAIETAKEVYKRRGIELTDVDFKILQHVYEITKNNIRL